MQPNVPATRRNNRSAAVLVAAVMALAACGTGGSDPEAPELACVTINGAGETVGNRDRLMGDGTFRFDGVERPGQVGLYLFEITDAANGGLDVETQYQFNWDNGDSFLTSDKIFFEPTLIPDHYTLRTNMTIVSGSGVFEDHVGEQPIALDATMQFGPPANPGDPRSAVEQFTISGQICPPGQ